MIESTVIDKTGTAVEKINLRTNLNELAQENFMLKLDLRDSEKDCEILKAQVLALQSKLDEIDKQEAIAEVVHGLLDGDDWGPLSACAVPLAGYDFDDIPDGTKLYLHPKPQQPHIPEEKQEPLHWVSLSKNFEIWQECSKGEEFNSKFWTKPIPVYEPIRDLRKDL